jgi:signal transduction histidine kinase
VLVTAVAGAGALGATSLTEDVDVLVDDYRPATYANIALRHDMYRAQSAARGWMLTDDSRFLREYRQASIKVRHDLDGLSDLLDDRTLGEPVVQQEVTVEQWLSFADGLVRREPGPVPAVYLLDGQIAFDRFIEHNDAVSFALNTGVDRKGDEARDDARSVIAFVVLASLLGLVLTAFVGRAVVRRVSEPMQEMEHAVERLAAGDLSARVSTDGPREIRGVANALNTLADENQRAREMEDEVMCRLRRLDRAKDEFVSSVSHELRTPLTSISGYNELFEEEFGELTSQQRGMLCVVRRNVGRLRSHIEDLMAQTMVEAHAFRTSLDPVDLGAVTREVEADVAEIAARAEVDVRRCGPGTQVMVRGDAGQLARALINLVTNAIKFSPPGSEVVLELATSGEVATAAVLDRGIGIPASELPTLGTRFYRASNAVDAEITGTGLGLRIVQTIADNHGGRLLLESVEGEGTVARIEIPLACDDDHGNISRSQEITEG